MFGSGYMFQKLECNNLWVKDSLCKFFELHDSCVVLSDHTKDGRRVHSVVKQFKKYGTQSAIRTFKNHQKKEWGFTIGINKYQNKMDPCHHARKENLGPFTEKEGKKHDETKWGFNFLVRHHDKNCSYESILASDLRTQSKKQ